MTMKFKKLNVKKVQKRYLIFEVKIINLFKLIIIFMSRFQSMNAVL